MTLALVLLIRRRTREMPDLPKGIAVERAREVLGERAEGAEDDQTRRIFAALLGAVDGSEFEHDLFDRLTPELILRIDAILLKSS